VRAFLSLRNQNCPDLSCTPKSVSRTQAGGRGHGKRKTSRASALFTDAPREIDEIEKLMKNKGIGNQSLQVEGAAMV